MSLFRKTPTLPKKTADVSMREILRLGTDSAPFVDYYTVSVAHWLGEFEWTCDSNRNLYIGSSLWPHVQRVYEQSKIIKKQRAKESDLGQENKALKKQVAELTAEIERLSQPTGRKILIEEKETTA